MRFIHTADWHLGKILKSQSLIDDQRYILEEFLRIVDKSRVDAIVIAGDIYDRNVPPEDAVNLFDQILSELIIDRGLPVLCIAGNHDSEGRLNFGNKLFDNARFHIRAKVTENIEPVILNDDFGAVYFSLIPYFEPSKVKAIFNLDDDADIDFDKAAEMLVKAARSKIPPDSRSVAVTHAFIAGGVESGSERKLPGGTERVNPRHFKDYDYTALGHLHSSTSTNNKIRYSGSLLKYSFDEWQQEKSITIVEIDGCGNVTIDNNLPLIPRHDVKIIKGTIKDIIEYVPDSDDYISVQYEGVNLPNLNSKLRSKFPNLLEFKPIDRALSRVSERSRQLENISKVDLFEKFFKDTTGEDMTPKELKAVTKLIEDMERSGD